MSRDRPTVPSMLASSRSVEVPPRDTPLLPSRPQIAGPRRATLMVLSGMNAGRIVAVGEHGVVIGRGPTADLVVQDAGVSRRHARIAPGPEGSFLIEDLGSINGTFVAGHRVTLANVAPGDCVQLGTELRLRFSLTHSTDEFLQQRLYEASVRDALTRVYNRDYFARRLAIELAVARRTNGDLMLMMIDLDGLKQVNDGYGHLCGDRTLMVVAKEITTAVRVEDVLARYGGDEFVVLAARTGLDEALALAERVRHVVEKLRFSARGRRVEMTVSIGVATLAELTRDEDCGVELVALADERLYAAKHEGRNRVRPARTG